MPAKVVAAWTYKLAGGYRPWYWAPGMSASLSDASVTGGVTWKEAQERAGAVSSHSTELSRMPSAAFEGATPPPTIAPPPMAAEPKPNEETFRDTARKADDYAAPAREVPGADDLFGSASEATDEQARWASGVTSAAPGASDAAVPVHAARAHWPESDGSAAPLAATAEKKSQDVPESAPTSMVPEPSAIILALAALAYFLLFGRRRAV